MNLTIPNNNKGTVYQKRGSFNLIAVLWICMSTVLLIWMRTVLWICTNGVTYCICKIKHITITSELHISTKNEPILFSQDPSSPNLQLFHWQAYYPLLKAVTKMTHIKLRWEGGGGRTPLEVTFGFRPSVLHQRVKETRKLKAVYILLWWTSSFILLLRNLSEFSKKLLCPSNWVCSKDKAFSAIYLTFPLLWKQPYNSSSDNFTHTSYSAHSGLLSVFHQLQISIKHPDRTRFLSHCLHSLPIFTECQ